ncbi:hypothetical protein [Saccharothrix obliqua]|uniref:hypothetical protein n=1 Tax=Saccharothrix obliqua TaxID=2861747 RepID=UPI001C5DB0CB|nr:hypothetical protein [Saccharothrix obliqua]MBW4721185.1 hypothetical protein [Saccharothrix obliqua]
MLEDELKELFKELNIERRPRTFGAADIIYHGQVVRGRRRAAAVAGSAFGATMLVVTVGFVLASSPEPANDPATPPTQVETTTPLPTESRPTPVTPTAPLDGTEDVEPSATTEPDSNSGPTRSPTQGTPMSVNDIPVTTLATPSPTAFEVAAYETHPTEALTHR